MLPTDPSPTIDPAIEEQAQASVLKTLLATAQHFLGRFIHLFAGVNDAQWPCATPSHSFHPAIQLHDALPNARQKALCLVIIVELLARSDPHRHKPAQRQDTDWSVFMRGGEPRS